MASQRVQEPCMTEHHVDTETLAKESLAQRRGGPAGEVRRQVMEGKV